ncbi:MAG: AAA family ATPase [Hyphomicrobiaceae bacterium]|nr:AAA family ATPase [Hyphomicrobiaceae bacterium]
MTKQSPQAAEAHSEQEALSPELVRLERARPIPRISIQAFCEDQHTVEVMHAASGDRRLAKSHLSVHMGGAQAAVRHYVDSPTPNLIILESSLPKEQLLAELDRLAESCDAGTKVMIIGRANDVALYRELLRRGVSEYLVAPLDTLLLIESLSNIYNDPEKDPVGNVIAFIGAKGGVGSSTICHNVAYAMSEGSKSDVVVADLDLAFGTTGLDFNQDPVQGIADALLSPERLDEVLLDRLLTRCSDHLSIFSAPVVLDRDFDVTATACNAVLDVVRQNVPTVAVDLPHAWTPWIKSVLSNADDIVVTAMPDLANLRNAKNIFDMLRAKRNNDAPPRLVINMARMPKRPEISIKEFTAALGVQPSLVLEFESEVFGLAANNGQMVEECSPKAKAAAQFRDLAFMLSKRKEYKNEARKAPAGALAPLLQKLKIKL